MLTILTILTMPTHPNYLAQRGWTLAHLLAGVGHCRTFSERQTQSLILGLYVPKYPVY